MVSDCSSSSNFSEVVVQHIHLDWTVDFQAKCIGGTALLDIDVLKQTSQIILDAKELAIDKIQVNEVDCKFVVEEVGVCGQRLSVSTAQLTAGSKIQVSVYYKTTAECSALQFVDAQLTADKVQPFLYSQCEPIHCRSIVPCMDTPSVKQTYSAKVTAPQGITVLMSGISQDTVTNADGSASYSFVQKIPVPTYLIAIVAGGLAKRDISNRCAIWAEPSLVDQARWEMEETEIMLKTAEDLLGEYVWGRYDMVVLPPFFPFGGMENPCLTFVTPTIIANDRSNISLIAHEITHSWTGNLVTNANWEHFWLNEGFTQFVERKIMGRVYGENIRQFQSLNGWEDNMLPTINTVFNPTHNFTKLVPNMAGCDPDDAFSVIPYEKGSAFLLYLEQQLGDTPKFEEFLRFYIARFSYKSIVTEDWKSCLYEFFSGQKDVLDTIDFDTWLNNPGVPPNKPKYDESLVNECRQLAAKWLNASDQEVLQLKKQQFSDMTAGQKVKVLDCIEAGEPLSTNRVEHLEKLYSLNSVGNYEILKSWILIAIKANWTPIIEFALEFVTKQGRMKFVKPVYRKLLSWEESKQKALETFEKNIPYMHPITAAVVGTIIKSTVT